MQLTLREATTYLKVDEGTIRHWIKSCGLPAHRVNERLMLNAIEGWEWATEDGADIARVHDSASSDSGGPRAHGRGQASRSGV